MEKPPSDGNSNPPTTSEPMPVIFETKGKIGYVLVQTKLNIFTLEMAEDITKNLREMIENPRIKVIVFKTAGTRIFSAGWDLSLFQTGLTLPKIEKIVRIGSLLTRTIIDCKKPTIAQIQGSAIGFGCILAMACDFRICADQPELFFQLPEFSLGIYPGTGATAAPLKTLGVEHTREMLLTGKKIPLTQMNMWGAITEILPIDELPKSTKKFAKTIAKSDGMMITLLQHALPRMGAVSDTHLMDLEEKFTYYYFHKTFKQESRDLAEFLKDLDSK